MKNIFKIMLFVALATFTFTSCNKENAPAVQAEDTVLDFTMEYANYSGNDTKATKKEWADGDLVYMMFKKTGTTEYDFMNYVKMQYNGTSKTWKVVKGQEVLNNLPEGKGEVSAVHHTGIEDPVLNTEKEENVFSAGEGDWNKACFAISARGIQYTKESDKIKATLQFKSVDPFQFNIKGLNYVSGKYELNIYKGTEKVTKNSFGCFYFNKSDARNYSGPYSHIPAQKGLDSKDEEISFFVGFSIYNSALKGCYKNEGGINIFTFDPTFELVINIGGIRYYAQRTITGKSYKEYNAYSLNGPNKTDADIKAAADGADLGNGWKKGKVK